MTQHYFVKPALVSLCVALLCMTSLVEAQGAGDPSAEGSPPEDPMLTMFPHSQTARWWISGQENIVTQWHPSFDAKYSGPNSFRAEAEHATSNIGTLFTGYQLTGTTEIFMHFEMADGGASATHWAWAVSPISMSCATQRWEPLLTLRGE